MSNLIKKYRMETPRTEQAILEFLSRIRSNYNLERIKVLFSGGEQSDAFRFAGFRVLPIIQDLAASMHLRLAQNKFSIVHNVEMEIYYTQGYGCVRHDIAGYHIT